MVKQDIKNDLKRVVEGLGFESTDIVVSIPENSQFGDYTSNVALQLAKHKAKKHYQNPREIANDILENFGHPRYLQTIEIAGPGFLNFFLKDKVLLENLKAGVNLKPSGKKILVEYASPNAAKPLHIGHLRNISLGESLSRLLEFGGSNIFRVSYTADIGLPIAKVIWGIKQEEEKYNNVKNASPREKSKFLGQVYANSHSSYESDGTAKSEIDVINKAIYARDPKFVPLWDEIRDWSKEYFEIIYKKFGSKFDATIWESEVESVGKRLVEENIGKVFIQSQGAIIFPGKKYGLHDRVFISSVGNPTYEAKELGVTKKEEDLFPFDIALHIVGKEQIGYFQVVIKAVEMIDQQIKDRKIHVPYGYVNLSTGKMSSRKGNIITVDDLLDQVIDEILKQYPQNKSKENDDSIEKIAIAAIKFWFLKYSSISDITFDIERAISLKGDSGPYLLYAYARTASLLSKSKVTNFKFEINDQKIETEERILLQRLEYFEHFTESAAWNFEPNQIAEYLLELSKEFNQFYEKYPIIGSNQADFRLLLSKKVGETLKQGLYLMGIETLEKM